MLREFLSKLRAIAAAAAAAIFMLILLVVGPFWLMVIRYLESPGRRNEAVMRGV